MAILGDRQFICGHNPGNVREKEWSYKRRRKKGTDKEFMFTDGTLKDLFLHTPLCI